MEVLEHVDNPASFPICLCYASQGRPSIPVHPNRKRSFKLCSQFYSYPSNSTFVFAAPFPNVQAFVEYLLLFIPPPFFANAGSLLPHNQGLLLSQSFVMLPPLFSLSFAFLTPRFFRIHHWHTPPGIIQVPSPAAERVCKLRRWGSQLLPEAR